MTKAQRIGYRAKTETEYEIIKVFYDEVTESYIDDLFSAYHVIEEDFSAIHDNPRSIS